MDITQIIVAIIGLMGVVITAVIIPWIRQKIGSEKFDRMMKITGVIVAAAEQMGAQGLLPKGLTKLDYALTQVQKALSDAGIKYNEDAVRSAIEAFVADINDRAYIASNMTGE